MRRAVIRYEQTVWLTWTAYFGKTLLAEMTKTAQAAADAAAALTVAVDNLGIDAGVDAGVEAKP